MAFVYTVLKKENFNEIRDLVGDAWYTDYIDNKKIYKLYTSYYLYHYVAESEYRMIVKDKDKVIGFLFGKAKKVNLFHYLRYELKVFFLGVGALFSKLGRRGIKVTLKTNQVNKKLKKMACDKTCAELSLFIVDKEYRNLGIGTELERIYLSYLKENNFKYVYLYTDTYSDYKFYERKGYYNAGGMEVDFDVDDEEETIPQYFIYKKAL